MGRRDRRSKVRETWDGRYNERICILCQAATSLLLTLQIHLFPLLSLHNVNKYMDLIDEGIILLEDYLGTRICIYVVVFTVLMIINALVCITITIISIAITPDSFQKLQYPHLNPTRTLPSNPGYSIQSQPHKSILTTSFLTYINLHIM